jgi:hypothetical protein
LKLHSLSRLLNPLSRLLNRDPCPLGYRDLGLSVKALDNALFAHLPRSMALLFPRSRTIQAKVNPLPRNTPRIDSTGNLFEARTRIRAINPRP